MTFSLRFDIDLYVNIHAICVPPSGAQEKKQSTKNRISGPAENSAGSDKCITTPIAPRKGEQGGKKKRARRLPGSTGVTAPRIRITEYDPAHPSIQSPTADPGAL